MARKKQKINDDALRFFDVLYEDGSRSSNRKIQYSELDSFDEMASAKAILEAQDRKIAELSGRPRSVIKSVTRSGS